MRALLMSVAMAGMLAACGQQQQAEQPQTEQAAPDPAAVRAAAIAAATAQARESLPRFWELQQANDGEAFWLKVAYATPDGGVEEVWLNRVHGTASGPVGSVQNEPENLPNVHRGQTAPINVDQITDWSITREGKTYGHFTTRAILESNPERTAENDAFLRSLEVNLP